MFSFCSQASEHENQHADATGPSLGTLLVFLCDLQSAHQQLAQENGKIGDKYYGINRK